MTNNTLLCLFDEVQENVSLITPGDREHLERIETEYKAYLNEVRFLIYKLSGVRDNKEEKPIHKNGITFNIENKLIKELEEGIDDRFWRYINDIWSYITEEYLLPHKQVPEIKSEERFISAEEIVEKMLKYFGKDSFSLVGYDYFLRKAASSLSSEVSGNKINLKHLILYSDYRGTMRRYDNSSYFTLLEALSFYENKRNSETFRKGDVDIIASYQNVLPFEDDLMISVNRGKLIFGENSKILESIRFFKNGRVTIEFKSEHFARDFFTHFVERNCYLP